MRQKFIDRVVAYFAPRQGLLRAYDRRRLEFAYQGGETGRRATGFSTRVGSADAELDRARPYLVARSRELIENNPYANKAVETWVSNTIGEGVTPDSTDDRLQDLWDAWARSTRSDYEGDLDEYGRQALSVRTDKVSGSVILRRVKRNRGDLGEGVVPLQIHVMEPDYLDTTKSGTTTNGNRILSGQEFDRFGRRVAFWLYDQHPGDSYIIGNTSTRYPAEDIAYVHRKLRPHQTQGVPLMSPTLFALRDLGDYLGHEIYAKKLQSNLIGWIRRGTAADPMENQGDWGPSDDGEGGIRTMQMHSGQWQLVDDAEDVGMYDPKLSPNFDAFVMMHLHAIASGLGITYAQLTGDMANTSYSAWRGGHLQFKPALRQYQKHTVRARMLDPTWMWFADAAFSAGLVPQPVYAPTWGFPVIEDSDPLKDALAHQLEVRSGAKTLIRWIREKGGDPEKVFAEIAATNEKLDELEIVLDTDPRKVTKAGVGQFTDPLNPGDDGSDGGFSDGDLEKLALKLVSGDEANGEG